MPNVLRHIIIPRIRLLIQLLLGLRAPWPLKVSCFRRAISISASGQSQNLRDPKASSLSTSSFLPGLRNKISTLIHRNLAVVAGALGSRADLDFAAGKFGGYGLIDTGFDCWEG